MTLPARRDRNGDPTTLGRPLTLTDALAKELVGLLRLGLTQTDACLAVNLSRSTFYSWISRARDLSNTDPDPSKLTTEELRLLDFLDAVTRARSRAKADAVAAIRDAYGSDWRAAAWFLERSFPDEYGRRDTVAVEGDETVEIRVLWPEDLHTYEEAEIIDVDDPSPNGSEAPE